MSVLAFRSSLARVQPFITPFVLRAARPNPIHFRTLASMSSTQLDLATEVKIDHDNVRDLISRYNAEKDKDTKQAIGNTLVREMAIHSDSEEISFYEDLRVHGMHQEMEQDKAEHAEVKKLVWKADHDVLMSDSQSKLMNEAVKAFLEHAEEEENVHLPQLTAKLSKEENHKSAENFLSARKSVPTRPKPLAPQSGGLLQKAAGLQGAFHDYVVEGLMGRKFVELKYHHNGETASDPSPTI